MKVAIIGLGIGQVHLNYFKQHPEVEITGVVDTNTSVLKQICTRYKVPGFSSAHQLLRQNRPDGVSLCTPPCSHRSLTELFASSGVHILCEKPMAPTISDCEKMIEVCEKNKVFLMLGFKKRFSPTYRFLKQKFESEFGLPDWILIRFALGRVDKKWFWEEKDGGGPLVENTVHMIDLLHFFLGKVERVYAEGGNFFRPDFSPQIDTAIFTLRFEKGAIAGVGAGYASEWGFAREEISFATSKFAGQVAGPFDRPEKIQYIQRDKADEIQERNFINCDGFSEEISHFLSCLQGKSKPAVTGKEGLEALKVCLAVKKSIRQQKPVKLKE